MARSALWRPAASALAPPPGNGKALHGEFAERMGPSLNIARAPCHTLPPWSGQSPAMNALVARDLLRKMQGILHKKPLSAHERMPSIAGL
jgi:hypothetical protein